MRSSSARPGRSARDPEIVPRARKTKAPPVSIPVDRNEAVLDIAGRRVKLTNLRKPFWPELGITKGDLLRYYLRISPVLLPHLVDRAMVMKRYPNGAAGEYFFQKRAPVPRPDWIEICRIKHASGNIIDFPIVRDLATLLWVINLGCIDLNPWYARCDDVYRPDYLHFDLDPVPPAKFGKVLETAKILHRALDALGMPNVAKTTGSKGMHVYVPIVRGPLQKEVWTVAKTDGQKPRAAPSRDDHRRVPHREEAARPRPGRLQPERLGPDPGLGVFGAPEAPGDRLRACDLGRGREGHPHGGLPDRQYARAGGAGAAISGSRSSRSRSVSTCAGPDL